jgi:hypothetical protein
MGEYMPRICHTFMTKNKLQQIAGHSSGRVPLRKNTMRLLPSAAKNIVKTLILTIPQPIFVG